MSTQDHSWVPMRTPDYSRALMSTHKYGEMTLLLVVNAHGAIAKCSWLLRSPYDLWVILVQCHHANEYWWLFMSTQEHSGVWLHGTQSTNEHYWALMGAFEPSLVLMTAQEQSGAGCRGTNITHKHAGAFMNIELWRNEHLWSLMVPFPHIYKCSWGLISAHGFSWLLLSDPEWSFTWFSNKQKM